MKIIKETSIFEKGDWKVLDDFYEDGGELFDFLFAAEKKDDIMMYVKIAKKYGDSILEAACGSGRILIPLAKKGFHITGFDNSMRLLSIARNRIRKEDIGNNVYLFAGNMKDFSVKKKFTMVFVAYNTFNHILEEDHQKRFLHTVYNCLHPKGLFMMEVIHERKIGFSGVIYRRTKYNKKLNSSVEAYSTTSYDNTDNIEKVTWYYMVKRKKAVKSMYKTTFYRKVLRMDEISAMLKSTGFKEIELYGNYNLNKNSQENNIFIARRGKN